MNLHRPATLLVLVALVTGTVAGCRARRDACGDPVAVARASIEEAKR